MPRIRSIKPEFWTSEQVLECSTNARLLFVGMWNFADDKGRHPDSPKQLKAEIFPADDFTLDDIRGMIQELSRNGLITQYVVDNKGYLQVNGWHHQRIDKPQPAKYPSPEEGEITQFQEHSKNIQRTFPPDRIGYDTMGGDRIGKDRISPNGDMSGSAPDPKQQSNRKIRETAKSVIYFLNEKTGKNYQPVDGTLSPVIARLKEGFTEMQCRKVIANRCRKWGTDEKMMDYLRPKTLFNKTNFSNYVGELVEVKPDE